MSDHSNGVHRVFINSKFRRDTTQPTTKFTYYCEPTLTGVTKFKVNSVAVPISDYILQGLSSAERTVSITKNGRTYSVELKSNKVYSLADLVEELNVVFMPLSVLCKPGEGSTLQIENDSTGPIQLTSFPSAFANVSLPVTIQGSSGTFTVNNDFVDSYWESEVTNKGIKFLRIEYSDAGISTKVDIDLTKNANYNATELATLLNDSAAGTSIGFTWSVTSGGTGFTISMTPSSSANIRTVELTAHTADSDAAGLICFPGVTELVMTDTLDGAAVEKKMPLQGKAYTEAQFQSDLNFYLGKDDAAGEDVFTVSGGTISASYGPRAGFTTRTVLIKALDEVGAVTNEDKLNWTTNTVQTLNTSGTSNVTYTTTADFRLLPDTINPNAPFNLVPNIETIPALSTSAVTFTTTAQLVQSFEYTSSYRVQFQVNHAYTGAELVQTLNNALSAIGFNFSFGNNRLSVSNTNNGSTDTTRNLKLGVNEPLGLNAITEFPFGQLKEFPQEVDLDHHGSHTGETFTTPTLNFSSKTHCCYLALPNLVSSSRCGRGHRSFVKTIHNVNNAPYGSYIYYTNDGGSDFLYTDQQTVAEIQIELHGEDHQILDLQGMDIKCELEFR